MATRRALVCGAGGFIGSHVAKRLKRDGFWVRGVDLKKPEFGPTYADEFMLGDLREPAVCRRVIDISYDETYQLAADNGGAGYTYTGDNDAAILHNSILINLNVLEACRRRRPHAVFFASSACVYRQANQATLEQPITEESTASPANPDSDHGWEKLLGERLFFAYARNHALPVKIGRLHNVFGEEGAWTGGREAAPAAICRKVAAAKNGGEIEIWGDGEQRRSFLYIDECVDAMRRLMESDFGGPVNIGSDEMLSINELAEMVMEIAGKRLRVRHVEGPEGVRSRTSDNRLIARELGWAPSQPLYSGLKRTYRWVEAQVQERAVASALPFAAAAMPDRTRAIYGTGFAR